MLPFARMFEYGKVQETPYIKDITYGTSSNVCYMVLLSTGDLYTGGYNDSGQLGNGNKTNELRKLTFRVSNVRLISGSTSASMYVSNDNKVFLAGDRAIFNNGGSLSGWTVFTDITSTFSTVLDVSQIKRISCEVNTTILMNNGDLYGIGLNRYGEFGLGSTGYVGLTKIATDVKDVVGTAQSLIYQKNDGTIWGSGRNTSYVLKPSTEGGVNHENITSFRQLFSTVTDPILHVRFHTNSMCAFTSTEMYGYGENSRGQFGDGNTGAETNSGAPVSVSLPVPVLPNSTHQYTLYVNNYISTYVGTDLKLYSTGWNYNYAVGIGYITPDVVSTFTAVPGITIHPNDIIRCGYYNSYIGRVYNDILGCGKNTNATAMTTDTFNEFYQNLNKLPWKGA